MNADPKRMTHNHHSPVSKLIVPISAAIILFLLVIAPPALAQQQVFEVGPPVCTITYYPGYAAYSIGEGWRRLDGSGLSTSEYPELFNCLGYAYGGSGNTFYLPNLDGKFILTAGNVGSGHPTLGAVGGEISHTLTTAEMPLHGHGERAATSDVYGTSGTWVSRFSGNANVVNTSNSTLNTGGGQRHNNMPPYFALWGMIKAKPTNITVTVALTQVITSTQNITLTQVVTMGYDVPYSVYTTTLSSGDVFAVERRETYGEKYTNSLLFFICFLLIVNIVVTSIRSRR